MPKRYLDRDDTPVVDSTIVLVCRDCGSEFDFTATEQRLFADLNFTPPIRCHSCRKAKKAERYATSIQ